MRGWFGFKLLGACVAALCPGACGNGAPAPRGFGSYQVMPMRDATFSFNGDAPGYVFYATGSSGDGTLAHWRLDAETGTIEKLEPSTGGTPGSRYVCLEASAGKEFTVTVTDTQTGVETTVDQVAVYTSSCPTEADPSLTVWRDDGSGRLKLWAGRYDDLQPVPLPLIIDKILAVGSTSTRVGAERPDAPGEIGIFDIDNATDVVTELVSPVLTSAAWAEGATPVGPLESTSVDDSETPVGVMQVDGQIFYPRTTSDGGTTMFVTMIGASPSRELALFRVDAGAAVDDVVPFPAAQGVPTGSLAWQYSGASGDLLLVWDTPAQRLISCPGLDVFGPTADSSLDGRRFLFGVQSAPSSPVAGGPLVLVSPDGDGRDGTCTQLAAADAHDHQFSPAGSLAWLVDVPEGSALWTAAGDGSAAREIGRGPIQTAPWSPYFFAASALEMRIARDLVWIDVNDDPVKMHYIAQDVFVRPLDYDRQVLIGYDWSDQDGTGTLGLVDRETGAKRLISSQVVTYYAARPASADSSVQNYIVYLVRGRNPSSQDGLWVATITKDDVR